VLYTNDLTNKKVAEYVVAPNAIGAEQRADFKLIHRLRGGFLEAPFSRWECVKVKQMDDKPYKPEDSQVFYV
jgi:hypothetical protein